MATRVKPKGVKRTQLHDYNASLRVMRAIEKRMVKTINRERPRYSYAFVTDMNVSDYTVQVIDDPNDPNDSPYWVQGGGGNMPTAVGQKVRIDGQRGDRFISGVIGAAATGPAGPTGPAGTIAIGTVTTAPYGSAANVTNTGTASAAMLNFTLPQGAPGPGVVTGMVALWPGTVPPSGFLACDGSAVSRTTYAALFNLIGTTFGAGDGATTFNLPDFRGVFPQGLPTGGAIGATGGAATHTHPLSNNGQALIMINSSGQVILDSSSQTLGVNGPTWMQSAPATLARSAGSGSTSTSTNLGGRTDAASTLPPFMNMLFIIKT